jgi:hypothetical protein
MSETTDRANATAKCPGSFRAGRQGKDGRMVCRSCSFEWITTAAMPTEVPVAPWHRAVR